VQHTEQQLAAFQAEFARRRRSQIVASIPAVAVAIVMGLADPRRHQATASLPVAIVLPVALVVVLAVVLFSFRNWRCPACDGYLGRSLGPRFCPKCGVALR
jgi:hypothetical protein